MKIETIVRILQKNGNCYVSVDTLAKIGKKNIEKECGFEIEICSTRNQDDNGYILVKKTNI